MIGRRRVEGLVDGKTEGGVTDGMSKRLYGGKGGGMNKRRLESEEMDGRLGDWRSG